MNSLFPPTINFLPSTSSKLQVAEEFLDCGIGLTDKLEDSEGASLNWVFIVSPEILLVINLRLWQLLPW